MIRVVGESVKACLEVCCRLLFFFACDISNSFRCSKYCHERYHQLSYTRSDRTFTIYQSQGRPNIWIWMQVHSMNFRMSCGKNWSAKVYLCKCISGLPSSKVVECDGECGLLDRTGRAGAANSRFLYVEVEIY